MITVFTFVGQCFLRHTSGSRGKHSPTRTLSRPHQEDAGLNTRECTTSPVRVSTRMQPHVLRENVAKVQAARVDESEVALANKFRTTKGCSSGSMSSLGWCRNVRRVGRDDSTGSMGNIGGLSSHHRFRYPGRRIQQNNIVRTCQTRRLGYLADSNSPDAGPAGEASSSSTVAEMGSGIQ